MQLSQEAIKPVSKVCVTKKHLIFSTNVFRNSFQPEKYLTGYTQYTSRNTCRYLNNAPIDP